MAMGGRMQSRGRATKESGDQRISSFRSGSFNAKFTSCLESSPSHAGIVAYFLFDGVLFACKATEIHPVL